MKQKKMMILLTVLLLCCKNFVTAREAMLIEKRDGQVIITNNPKLASGAVKVEKLGQPEGLIFPVRSSRQRQRPRAERILTGIFSGREDAGDGLITPEEADSSVTRKRKSARQKTAATIAWKNTDGIMYHDPFLECSSETERVWVDNIKDLIGLEPCSECFIKTAHAPEFIMKESGGLDLASASELLLNQQFLAWADERLPIKNPGFISTRRLLIYPRMEMTENGLRQLAKEVEMAYRRHTWRVIEVIAKTSEIDTESVSSFGEESGNGSGDD